MNPKRTFDLDALTRIVPAAFANQAADFVSDKYTFVRTGDVLDDLYSRGWRAVAAYQSNSRKSDPLYQKHTVTMRLMEDDGVMPELGELFAGLKITNSHNHTSKFKTSQELLRMVCGNGMTVSEGDFGQYSIRHDMITEDIQTVMARFQSQSTKQMQTALDWSKLELTQEQANSFLIGATKLRFGELATTDKTIALNKSRRWADDGNTLWSLFNRVQENGMQGAAKHGEMKRKTRALTNIDAMDTWNSGLRDIAYETQALALA